jgi:predicted dehydrogenase
MTPSFGFEMSFCLVLERAVLVFDSRLKPTLTVYPKDGAAFSPPVAAGDGYEAEIRHFLSWVKGDRVSAVVTPEQARDAVRICLAEKESLSAGRKVPIH